MSSESDVGPGLESFAVEGAEPIRRVVPWVSSVPEDGEEMASGFDPSKLITTPVGPGCIWTVGEAHQQDLRGIVVGRPFGGDPHRQAALGGQFGP